jgi:hypothetical protein
MKDFFSYIYYRINESYFKWDGRKGFTSLLGVSMIQFMWPFVLLVLISKFTLEPTDLNRYGKAASYIGALIFFVIVFINYVVYNGKYNFYRSKWGNEERKKRIRKGILIVLLMAVPWILLPLIINSRF